MNAQPDPFRGVILGTALGDALGLPYEGLPPARVARWLHGTLRPHFLAGRAMVSDDTEHTIMTAQSLLRFPEDADAFARDLAWRLRGWLLGAPAGVGFATLRSVLKLWIGFGPASSGVYSAGNGPAMRAAVLGVCLGDRAELLEAYVRASSRMTHTDPRAEAGALRVARAAHAAATGSTSALATLAADVAAFEAGPKGVSGFIEHTVPAALTACATSGGDYRRCIETCVRWGGDTDTVAAIAGGIMGAAVGEEGLPPEWVEGLWEWPRSVAWMRTLADRLRATFRDGERPGPMAMAWPLVPLRNALFAGTVLAHGFRRLGPPY
jgi:ADP-ribosylglycohydrolase